MSRKERRAADKAFAGSAMKKAKMNDETSSLRSLTPVSIGSSAPGEELIVYLRNGDKDDRKDAIHEKKNLINEKINDL